MAELRKQWDNGGLLTVAYEGDGDGSAVFTSEANEGIDREMTVAFKGGGVSIERIVKQEGRRTRIITADGYFFNGADGVFGALKQ